MGYFPNGTSSEDYEASYCDRCANQKIDDGGCFIWLLHLLHNYEECNNEKSFLHKLIPMDENGFNKKCTMFLQVGSE